MSPDCPYVLTDAELDALLREDAPYGDATTRALGIGRQAGEMRFHARTDMQVCGTEEALRMAQLRGVADATLHKASGEAAAAGDLLLTLRGSTGALHEVWKTAQTLVEYLSGIASATHEIVAAAQAVNPQIAVVCTRKNFPGCKRASLKAILCGGAQPHRLGLSETLLLFAEHRAFLGADSPETTVHRLKQQWPERQLTVEVGEHDEALRWAHAGADVLQLERFSPPALHVLATALKATPPTQCPRLAAAGGVNRDNAADYARAGADLLVTSAPYFAKPKDVAVALRAA